MCSYLLSPAREREKKKNKLMKRCVMRRAFCTHTYRVRLPFVFVHEPAAHTHTSGEELRKKGGGGD